MLVKVFRIAEREGWDAARLSWLHTNGILEQFARRESLFGSIDDQVFRFLKREQNYYQQAECSRVQCKKRKRNFTTAELHL
jgi:hypothetical protein